MPNASTATLFPFLVFAPTSFPPLYSCKITKMMTPRAPKYSRGDEIAEWAREELNLRPHAYQALPQSTGIRRKTDNSLIGLATCRDSPIESGLISDSNRDRTATDDQDAGVDARSPPVSVSTLTL
jgi:hypothetical protein